MSVLERDRLERTDVAEIHKYSPTTGKTCCLLTLRLCRGCVSTKQGKVKLERASQRHTYPFGLVDTRHFIHTLHHGLCLCLNLFGRNVGLLTPRLSKMMRAPLWLVSTWRTCVSHDCIIIIVIITLTAAACSCCWSCCCNCC